MESVVFQITCIYTLGACIFSIESNRIGVLFLANQIWPKYEISAFEIPKKLAANEYNTYDYIGGRRENNQKHGLLIHTQSIHSIFAFFKQKGTTTYYAHPIVSVQQ